MNTITGDTQTFDFSNLLSGAGFAWGSSELFGCCVGISCLAKPITMHIADRVGILCVDSTADCEVSLGYALKFRRCITIATEILLDGNTTIAAYQFSSVTEAGNLYSSLNDSFQKMVTIPYVRLKKPTSRN